MFFLKDEVVGKKMWDRGSENERAGTKNIYIWGKAKKCQGGVKKTFLERV